MSQVLFGALFIGSLYYWNLPVNEGKFNKIMNFMGLISFEFYLYNVVMLNLLGNPIVLFISNYANNKLIWGLVVSLIAIVTAIPISMLSKKYITDPISRFINLKLNNW